MTIICNVLWASSARRCLQALVLLGVLACANAARADDVLSVRPVTAMLPGATGQLAVEIENTTPFVAFQFDLSLSEGLAVAMNEGKYAVTLTSRASSEHMVSTRLQSNGKLRVAVVSMSNALFSGKDGAVLLISVDVAENCGSEGTVTLENVRITQEGAKEVKLDDVTATFHIGLLPGDANGDGRVSIVDVTAVVNYLLAPSLEGFLFRAADMDGNNKITFADAIAIVNIIQGK